MTPLIEPSFFSVKTLLGLGAFGSGCWPGVAPTGGDPVAGCGAGGPPTVGPPPPDGVMPESGAAAAPVKRLISEVVLG
jgi:hypothetical protein